MSSRGRAVHRVPRTAMYYVHVRAATFVAERALYTRSMSVKEKEVVHVGTRCFFFIYVHRIYKKYYNYYQCTIGYYNNYYTIQEAHNTSLSHGHGPQSRLCQWCWMSRALELDDELMSVNHGGT